MNLLEQAEEVMIDVKGALHVRDIASLIIERYPNLEIPADELPDKIAQKLNADTKKKTKDARFAKVKNKNGSFKKGIYRLKRRPIIKIKPTPPPPINNQYTGSAGEFAVMSELLFYGFNTSSMTVDDGIDIVASKDARYFHIQVKTSNPSADGNYSFSVKKSSFNAKHSFSTFYIFVITLHDKKSRIGSRFQGS